MDNGIINSRTINPIAAALNITEPELKILKAMSKLRLLVELPANEGCDATLAGARRDSDQSWRYGAKFGLLEFIGKQVTTEIHVRHQIQVP
jgi:hypothetical protein